MDGTPAIRISSGAGGPSEFPPNRPTHRHFSVSEIGAAPEGGEDCGWELRRQGLPQLGSTDLNHLGPLGKAATKLSTVGRPFVGKTIPVPLFPGLS